MVSRIHHKNHKYNNLLDRYSGEIAVDYFGMKKVIVIAACTKKSRAARCALRYHAKCVCTTVSADHAVKNHKFLAFLPSYLGIMEVWLTVPLKPFDTKVLWCLRGFWEAVNRVPMMSSNARLSDSCTPDRCSFSSMWAPATIKNYTSPTRSSLINIAFMGFSFRIAIISLKRIFLIIIH